MDSISLADEQNHGVVYGRSRPPNKRLSNNMIYITKQQPNHPANTQPLQRHPVNYSTFLPLASNSLVDYRQTRDPWYKRVYAVG